jgi:cyclic pyranopterin phosphate synthase
MNELSHVNNEGRATMVDISNKTMQNRIASARGKITLSKNTIKLLQENQIKKGDVLTVAQIAGIQAAKKTANLIPLCHPLILNEINVNLSIEKTGVLAESIIKCTGSTGVEMEALIAVSIALLTVYDMCKSVDKQMQIGEIILVEKVKQDVN